MHFTNGQKKVVLGRVASSEVCLRLAKKFEEAAVGNQDFSLSWAQMPTRVELALIGNEHATAKFRSLAAEGASILKLAGTVPDSTRPWEKWQIALKELTVVSDLVNPNPLCRRIPDAFTASATCCYLLACMDLAIEPSEPPYPDPAACPDGPLPPHAAVERDRPGLSDRAFEHRLAPLVPGNELETKCESPDNEKEERAPVQSTWLEQFQETGILSSDIPVTGDGAIMQLFDESAEFWDDVGSLGVERPKIHTAPATADNQLSPAKTESTPLLAADAARWAQALDTAEGRKTAREEWKRHWATAERECTNDDLTETAFGQKDSPFLNQWENGKTRLKEPSRSSRVQAIERVLRENIPPRWHSSARRG